MSKHTGTDGGRMIRHGSKLQFCEDCETFFIKQHKCGRDPDKHVSGTTRDDREELRQRDIDAPESAPDDTVHYIVGRGPHAYHVDGCYRTPNRDDRELTSATRGEMWESNNYPCRDCHEYL